MLQQIDFINELETLCRKYKIVIDGCGCFDSPYLENYQDIDNTIFEDRLKLTIDHFKDQ